MNHHNHNSHGNNFGYLNDNDAENEKSVNVNALEHGGNQMYDNYDNYGENRDRNNLNLNNMNNNVNNMNKLTNEINILIILMAIMAIIITGSKKNLNLHSTRNGNNENSFRTVNIVNNNHNNNNINNNKNKKKHESNSGEWKSHNVPMTTKSRNGLNVQAQEWVSHSSINNYHSLNNRTGYQSSRRIHASNVINAVNCYGSSRMVVFHLYLQILHQIH